MGVPGKEIVKQNGVEKADKIFEDQIADIRTCDGEVLYKNPELLRRLGIDIEDAQNR